MIPDDEQESDEYGDELPPAPAPEEQPESDAEAQQFGDINAGIIRLEDLIQRQQDHIDEIYRRLGEQETDDSASTGGGSFRFVNVSQSGGSAGDQSTPCTFTYDVIDRASGETLGSDVQVTMKRYINAAYDPASIGIASYDSGTLTLIWVDEKAHQKNCA